MKTGLKRRSNAASFSTCLRYSSSVVAPIQCNSPRASAGFNSWPAPTAPSPWPAPTIVWSSSIKRIMRPSLEATSRRTALSLSSNSPRNFAPASNAPTSSAMIREVRIDSGQSPFMMRCASPSAIAVLPTPGSPISTGLFFVLLDKTCMHLRISSSRPMTGSSFPLAASSFRSFPYFLSASYVLSAPGS